MKEKKARNTDTLRVFRILRMLRTFRSSRESGREARAFIRVILVQFVARALFVLRCAFLDLCRFLLPGIAFHHLWGYPGLMLVTMGHGNHSFWGRHRQSFCQKGHVPVLVSHAVTRHCASLRPNAKAKHGSRVCRTCSSKISRWDPWQRIGCPLLGP